MVYPHGGIVNKLPHSLFAQQKTTLVGVVFVKDFLIKIALTVRQILEKRTRRKPRKFWSRDLKIGNYHISMHPERRKNNLTEIYTSVRLF